MATDLELIKRAFELLDSNTYEQVLPIVDEEFEMVTTAEVASEPNTYRGPEGVRRWWLEFLDAMDRVYLEALNYSELNDGRVIVEFIIHARGKHSGIEAGQPAVAIATASHGKLLRLEFFTSVESARAAAEPPPG
ncbi:MAG: nuclear transport factor 2 family protein [Vicinamibacteria bacterium]